MWLIAVLNSRISLLVIVLTNVLQDIGDTLATILVFNNVLMENMDMKELPLLREHAILQLICLAMLPPYLEIPNLKSILQYVQLLPDSTLVTEI